MSISYGTALNPSKNHGSTKHELRQSYSHFVGLWPSAYRNSPSYSGEQGRDEDCPIAFLLLAIWSANSYFKHQA